MNCAKALMNALICVYSLLTPTFKFYRFINYAIQVHMYCIEILNVFIGVHTQHTHTLTQNMHEIVRWTILSFVSRATIDYGPQLVNEQFSIAV